MKNLKENLPLILLVILVPYFFYAAPNMAQSVITAALSALAGFKLYLDQKQLPDYEKVFAERLDLQAKKLDENFKTIENELISIKKKQGTLSLVEAQKERIESFKW